MSQYYQMRERVFKEQQEYDNVQRQKARERNLFLKYHPAIKAQIEVSLPRQGKSIHLADP